MRSTDTPSMGLILRVIFLTLYFAIQSTLNNVASKLTRSARWALFQLQLGIYRGLEWAVRGIHSRLFRKSTAFSHTHAELRSMPTHTVGFALAQWLDGHGHTLIRNYENHDIQHLILDYTPTLVGEYQLHAFMLGNRHHSFLTYGALCIATLTCPQAWGPMFRAYLRGQQCAVQIGQLDFVRICSEGIADIRHEINRAA